MGFSVDVVNRVLVQHCCYLDAGRYTCPLMGCLVACSGAGLARRVQGTDVWLPGCSNGLIPSDAKLTREPGPAETDFDFVSPGPSSLGAARA